MSCKDVRYCRQFRIPYFPLGTSLRKLVRCEASLNARRFSIDIRKRNEYLEAVLVTLLQEPT